MPNSIQPSASTEEKIRQAAKQVFLEKGFDGATTRDIAQVAGINIALTNYYFRSKEKLFMSIFAEILDAFFVGMTGVLSRPVGLREKIVALIEHDHASLKANPDLAVFIMNEIHRDPKRMATSIGLMKQRHLADFEQQLRQEIDQGRVRPIDADQLIPLITSHSQFLFANKAMHMELWHLDETQFNAYADRQKDLTIDMVTKYLFFDQPE